MNVKKQSRSNKVGYNEGFIALVHSLALHVDYFVHRNNHVQPHAKLIVATNHWNYVLEVVDYYIDNN